jgi:hypothetical protein
MIRNVGFQSEQQFQDAVAAMRRACGNKHSVRRMATDHVIRDHGDGLYGSYGTSHT